MKNLTTNQIIVGIAVLVIGFGLGYTVRGNTSPQMGNHMMSSGQMMGDHMMGGNMQDAMQGMMAGLQGKTGDEFDQAFLSEMVMHHQGAVVMAQAVLETSKRSELIQLAKDIISAQTREINMMRNWQKNWFNQ